MNQVNLNGKLFSADEPVLLASNRGYRYGDGLFETMKMVNGQIPLATHHFERLFNGLRVLRYQIPGLFTPDKLQQEILHLCKRNECENLARVRLSVFRGNGGLYESQTDLQYLVECWPLPGSSDSINENGLVLGIYPGSRKNSDEFSNLKTANFLLYSMAAYFAKEQKWNDCLVLNAEHRICDATTANLFIIKDGIIRTPPLTEACVAGVMRRKILELSSQPGMLSMPVEEIALQTTDLLNADEIFLTNAIHGIRWVGQCLDKTFTGAKTQEIYHSLFKTIPV